MKLQRLLAASAACLLASAVAAPAGAATFNVFDAFNGTATGAAGSGYTFGYTAAGAFSGTLTPYNTTCLTGDANVQCASSTVVGEASISKATVNGGEYDINGTGFYNAGELNFHPGTNGENSGFQFTAATVGSFAYSIGLSVNDSATSFHSVDYRLFQGTTLLASGILNNGLTTSLTGNVDTSNGNVFTFLIGANGDFRYDSTGVAASFSSAVVPPVTDGAVPEPATWGLMLLGFGAVGSVMRRKPAGRSATTLG